MSPDEIEAHLCQLYFWRMAPAECRESFIDQASLIECDKDTIKTAYIWFYTGWMGKVNYQ